SQGAVGLSFGVERLIGLVEERGGKTVAGRLPVIVAALGGGQVGAGAKLLLGLRGRGVVGRFLGGQEKDKILKYSTQSELPRVILVGEEEAKSGVYALRDAESRQEQRLDVEGLALTLLK